MAFFETFSQRRARAARAGEAEVYTYDDIPEALVNQIIMIWNEAFEFGHVFKIGERHFDASDIWASVEVDLIRAHGLPSLYEARGRHDISDAHYRVEYFFRNTDNNDYRLDIVEMVFNTLATTDIAAAPRLIEELNFRFKQSGVGYQFVGVQLIRLDNTVAHEEMVKPALILLGRKGFEQADQQYRSAHEHYRRNEYSQAITEAGKAFESAMKAICAQKNWSYEPGARMTDLVKLVVSNGLFPTYLDKGLESYLAMMKTGLPGTRNNAGPHGTAPNATPVPAYLARYALHMSATNILMVVEAAESMGKQK